MTTLAFLCKLACLFLFTGTLVHVSVRALRRILDRVPTVDEPAEPEIPVYESLSPEPFVDAQPTQDAAPLRCDLCREVIADEQVAHYTLDGGPYHGSCALMATRPKGAA